MQKKKSGKFLNEKNVKITTFVTTLVLVFKKIESDDKTKYDTSFSLSKVETIINESAIDMYLNQSILQSYETY